MSISEKLTTIAENQEKVYNKGGLDYSPQETVSGEAIGITDISPIEHNMGVSVMGKNLIPNIYKTVTSNGVTFAVAKDGSITANGTAEKNIAWVVIPTSKPIKLLNGEIYSLSGSPKGSSYSTYYMAVQSTDYTKTYNDVGNGITFTSTGKDVYFYISVQAGTTLEDVVFKPLLEKGAVKTEFAPYIEDISTVKLYKQGKNILKYPYYYSTKTLSGITYTDNGDGSITVNGTATAFTLFEITQQSKNDCNDLFVDGATYKLSSGVDNALVRLVLGARKISENKPVYYYSGDTFTVDKSIYKYEWIRLQIESGKIINNVTVYPMIEIGNSATEYEPYIEPTVYDVQSDGIVEGVKSLYPNTTLYTDTSGAVIGCTYYQDGRKVKENLTDMILSLGGVINE